MEAIKGVNKEMSARTRVVCNRCSGSRAEPGTSFSKCSTCNGSGQVYCTVMAMIRIKLRRLKLNLYEHGFPYYGNYAIFLIFSKLKGLTSDDAFVTY